MNDLLRTRFFILLADTSQEVINTEMQDAYDDFVKQIVTISNSEDYTHIFRMLNLTRIEIAPLKGVYQDGQGEKKKKAHLQPLRHVEAPLTGEGDKGPVVAHHLHLCPRLVVVHQEEDIGDRVVLPQPCPA